MEFRNTLLLDNGARFGEVMSPVQRSDFEAADPALKYITGASRTPAPIKQFFEMRSRGYSKTTDDAINALWTFAFARTPIIGYAAAEDKEQSELLLEQARMVVHSNPWLSKLVDIQRKAIVNRNNGATLKIMSRDVGSSFGLTPQYMLAQEFTHWTQEIFWSSFYSSYAKQRDRGAVLFVSCNAGYGTDFRYQLKETARTSPHSWYYSAPDGWAPWYSEETIQEQRRGLIPSEFERLWLNRWTSSAGEYITLEEADRCINQNLEEREQSQVPGWCYVAALDYAEKNDNAVGTVVHQYEKRIIVDRMDVISPEICPDGIIRVEWCKRWMKNIKQRFGNVYFVVDPWQLKAIVNELRDEGYHIEEFEFQGGNGNWRLSKILRQLVLNNRLEWYPGCGQIMKGGTPWLPRGLREDLSTELAALNAKPLPGGKWRLEHDSSGHDDRAFSLGAACMFIVENGDGFEDIWSSPR